MADQIGMTPPRLKPDVSPRVYVIRPAARARLEDHYAAQAALYARGRVGRRPAAVAPAGERLARECSGGTHSPRGLGGVSRGGGGSPR